MRWPRAVVVGCMACGHAAQHQPPGPGAQLGGPDAAPAQPDARKTGDDGPAMIAVSVAPVVRLPIARRDLALSYRGPTLGIGVDFGVPNKRSLHASTDRYLFYHFSADAMCMYDSRLGEPDFPFCGYRVAPIGAGFWWGREGFIEEMGIVTTGPQLEYMAPRSGLPFPAQSTTMLGIGMQLYLGGFLDSKGHFTAGVAVGVDVRLLTVQDAGVAAGLGADFLVRPMIGVQGW